MEFNNQEELMQAAADVYSVAETIYKGIEKGYLSVIEDGIERMICSK